jgi:hypothetical protein
MLKAQLFYSSTCPTCGHLSETLTASQNYSKKALELRAMHGDRPSCTKCQTRPQDCIIPIIIPVSLTNAAQCADDGERFGLPMLRRAVRRSGVVGNPLANSLKV